MREPFALAAISCLALLAASCGGSNSSIAFPFPDADCDGIEDSVDPMFTDGDADLIGDGCDNCPADANPINGAGGVDCNMDGDSVDNNEEPGAQCDIDNDNIGDVCDLDKDGDGIPNDGTGDGMNLLADGCTGGMTGGCDDNCELIPNLTQVDTDGDMLGDACDP